MRRLTSLIVAATMLALQAQGVLAQSTVLEKSEAPRPNILLAISDDQSWPHTSLAGSSFVRTPNLDRVAANGFHFRNGYAASPGCSPSRAALLTGQHHWMIGPAGTHGSSFPAHYETFVDLLDEAGYKVGFTGKGWGPGEWQQGGRDRNPAGDEYNGQILDIKPTKGISSIDYAANFSHFMRERKEGEPFFFWYGGREPHLKYADETYSDTDRVRVKVPSFLPDTPIVRDTLLDYAHEIEHFDNHLGMMLSQLEQAGELDNTLVIVTSDNGMPFPRAKATGYDYGIHVPMAMYWEASRRKGVLVDTPIGFVDLSATIMEVAGLSVPEQFTGDSLLGLLDGSAETLDDDRSVFAGRERQTAARYQNMSYPQRMMRRGDYLIIWNLKPDRLPAGQGREIVDGELGPPHSAYYDVGPSRIKFEIQAKREDPYIEPFFKLMVEKRPEWQLYNVVKDPECLKNLAEDLAYADILAEYQQQLTDTLRATKDPRLAGYGIVWENYPRSKGAMRYFPKPGQGD